MAQQTIKTTTGTSTPMPSLTISLPLHVTVKPPRKDGTCRVLFEVRRDRPQGWPSTIPLPLTGRRRGNLNDPDEVARIFRDVEGTEEKQFQDGLLWKLEQARKGEAGEVAPAHPSESLPAIADLWEASWAPKKGAKPSIKPRTQDFYRKGLRILKAWAMRPKNRDKPMRAMTLPVLMKLLEQYDDRPAQRAALKRTLSALFSFAMITGAGGVKEHPFGVTPRLRRRHKRKRQVGLWDRGDVSFYDNIAATTPLPFADGAKVWAAAGRMIELMWETSADQTDVVTWRRDKNFRDGAQPAIQFYRGKIEGGELIVVPISQALAAKLRGCGSLYFVTDPDGRPYGADNVQDDNRRGGHFRTLQAAAVAAGGNRRVLDHLRHSAVTDALESGAQKEHVPSLTGHRGSQMIDQVYAQLTEKQAANVQRLRGIIE